jgi:uncharacterized protein
MIGEMVKRKSAERVTWQRIAERQFSVLQIDSGEFSGTVTLLQILSVHEPLWKPLGGQTICIADAGYGWMQHFPTHANHTVTTMFDASGQVVQWYIDICKAHGSDERGIPWYDDIYLDIMLAPGGAPELLDADELDAALAAGSITQDDWALAWREARQVHTVNDDERRPGHQAAWPVRPGALTVPAAGAGRFAAAPPLAEQSGRRALVRPWP